MTDRSSTQSGPPDSATSPARLGRWLRRWPWLVAVVLVIVCGMVVVPAILQYRAIQEIRALGGLVMCKKLKLYEALPDDWGNWITQRFDMGWMDGFRQNLVVSFFGDSIQEHDLRHLRHLKPPPSLAIIDTQLKEGGLPYICRFKTLRILQFSGSPVTDAGLNYLKEFPNLSTLSLDETIVTDNGLIHLIELVHLDELSLSNLPVTDAGMIHLKEMTQLKLLDLDHTQITDVGLAHLMEMPWLEQLSLVGTKVTYVEVGKLRKALPNCEVQHF